MLISKFFFNVFKIYLGVRIYSTSSQNMGFQADEYTLFIGASVTLENSITDQANAL